MPALILASTSPYRRTLLDRLGLEFSVEAPDVDESLEHGEPPADAVVRLACAKALTVAIRNPEALVVGCDQLAVLDERPLGKPGDEERAVAQLLAASGRDVEFVTAVALAGRRGEAPRSRLARNRVRFRAIDEKHARAYVARERPLDCAGAFKAEGLGIALFERIDGPDPNALVGLPLIELCTLLAQSGVDVLAPAPG